MNLDELLAQIKRHEGFKDRMYLDSEGIETIGVGHNLRDRPMDVSLLHIQGKLDLFTAIMDARDLCEQFEVRWRDLSEDRQHVLVDMSFNLGKYRLAMFQKMWGALHRQDYDRAADEALDSRWARQVGSRAGTLATMLRKG